MTNPQPHIHELGALDPVRAFTETFVNLVRLIEGIKASPGALPDKEILRAAETAVDTLEAIQEISCAGLMVQVLHLVGEEAAEESSRAYRESHEDLTGDAKRAYQTKLLKKFSQFIPVEHPPA